MFIADNSAAMLASSEYVGAVRATRELKLVKGFSADSVLVIEEGNGEGAGLKGIHVIGFKLFDSTENHFAACLLDLWLSGGHTSMKVPTQAGK